MIAIGSDHAGFEIKEAIIEWLTQNEIPVTDFGTVSNESVDYPDYANSIATTTNQNTNNTFFI